MSGPSTGHDSVPEGGLSTICFVGSSSLFSEVVLSTVEAGLERVRAFRLPDVATLSLVMRTQGDGNPLGQVSIVIGDERNTPALMDLSGRDLAQHVGLKRVIAFEDDTFASALLASERNRLIEKQISLLPMNTNVTTWVSLLRLIGTGGHYVPPYLLGRDDGAQSQSPHNEPAPETRQAHKARGKPAGPVTLTPREAEVLKHAAKGAPNKEIAHALDLSEHTVKLHMHRVIAKLKVKNRTEAAAWFHKQNGNP